MKTLRPGRLGSYMLLAAIVIANIFFFQNCENGSFDTPQALNTKDLASQVPNGQEPQEKQCLHPDNGQSVSPGFAYYTFSVSSGATQSACDAAKQTSYCDALTGTFVPALRTHKSCLVAGQTCAYTVGSGIASPTGNNEGSTVTGYPLSSATYPTTCGQEMTRICQANGNWNGTIPLYTSCTQKCVHPDNNQPVNLGTNYVYYTRQSGSQAECNAAKVTSTCSSSGQFSPAVGGTRYASCSVITLKSAYSPILAVKADEKVGTIDEPKDDPNPTSVGYIDNGDSLTFRNIDFENGAKSITLNIALIKESTFDPNSKVEIREGSASGTIIGTFIPQETGGWANFQDQSVNLTNTISGVNDITLAFVGDKGILNLKSLVFSKNTVVVPEPPPPPPPGTGGYGTREKPFSADSPFNTPIPAKATYASSSDPRNKDWQYSLTRAAPATTGVKWTMHVHQANRDLSNTKLFTVKIVNMLCYGKANNVKISFYAPIGAAPPEGNDSHFLIIDHEDNLHEMYYAKRSPTCLSGCASNCNGVAESGVDFYVLGHHKIPLSGTGVGNVGGRMTGFSSLGGLIRAGEITNVNGPQIEHAIALTIWGQGSDPNTPLGPNYVYPAARTGNNGNWTKSLRSGERLAIPRSVNIEALNIPETHKRLARALQKYGGYIADVGGSSAVWTEGILAGADKSALDSNSAAMRKIFELLVVVDNSF